jgi:hypothetical protein
MAQNESSPIKKSSAALIRQVVLVAILLIVAGAAVYDYRVARPGCHAAYEKIGDMADKRARSSDGPLTNTEIQAALDKKPTETISGANSYAEKYSWMAGMPFRSYFIWVVYSARSDGDPVFQTHFENEDIPPDLHPDYVYKANVDTQLPPDPVATGAGSGGGGGNRKGNPDGGNRKKGNEAEKAQDAPSDGAGKATSRDAPSGDAPSGNP